MQAWKKFILISVAVVFFQTTSAQDSVFHLRVFSDTHVGALKKMDPAPTGNGLNDLDVETFQQYLAQIEKLSIQTDAILVLGDLIDHFDANIIFGNAAAREKQLQINFSQFQQTFNITPIIYVFGNHDTLLGDNQAFFDNDYSSHSPYEIAMQSGWKTGSLSSGGDCGKNNAFPCVITENAINGFSAIYLTKKLRLINLNSVLFDDEYGRTYHGENYNDELIWLSQQILDAKDQQDSVLIAMHIPPGMDVHSKKPFWQQAAMQAFLQALKQYPSGILAVLAGHTHMEAMGMIVNENKSIIPIILTPGLSTSHGNAPAFKDFLLTQNAEGKWILKDFTTLSYIKNQFQPLYQFVSSYCPDHSEFNISACLQYLIQTKQDIISIMNQYYTAGNPNNHSPLPDDDIIHYMINLK